LLGGLSGTTLGRLANLVNKLAHSSHKAILLLLELLDHLLLAFRDLLSSTTWDSTLNFLDSGLDSLIEALSDYKELGEDLLLHSSQRIRNDLFLSKGIKGINLCLKGSDDLRLFIKFGRDHNIL
jgi:hypothetical protein